MLNKLQFNNMVISNKKGIQQSRIQTINKLVHKIRKLKSLLGKRPDDTKCKERVRKSTETMEHLKKIKRVDIMKKVLLLEKTPAAIITNGLSTPEEVAIALLAMNKVMEGLSKRFTAELKLTNADNSKWRDELMENSKRRQKIERTEEKKRKRIAVKEQKSIARKRQEWLEQNCQDGDREMDTKDLKFDISTVSGWKIEKIEEPLVKKEMTTHKDGITKLHQQLKKPRDDKKIKNAEREPPKRKKNLEENTVLVEEEEPYAQQDLASDIKDEEGLTNSRQSLTSNENDEESATETHVIDPFFVTETGENYLSTAVRSRIQGHDDNDADDRKDLHMIKLNGSNKYSNFHERKQQQPQSDRYPQKQNRNESKYPQTQNNWNEGKYPQQTKWNKQNDWKRPNEQQNSSKVRLPNNPSQKTEQKLHPSWAAKLKCKPVITGFQGKKIKFGDDDNVQLTNVNTVDMKNNRKDQPSQMVNSDSLHPSWAAKQKQKPIITAFQGKKISFNNDDE